MTSIGDGAFRYCSSLTSIELPNSVTSIGSHAFYGCSSLTSIELPNSVTSIGTYAFYKCSRDLIIYGSSGSYAETYAKNNNIKFETISFGMSGIYVGKLNISTIGGDSASYDDYTVEIDGTTYKISPSADLAIYNTLTDFILSQKREQKVVYQIKNGCLYKIADIASVLVPKVSVIATPDSFIYNDGAFQQTSLQAEVKLECMVSGTSPFKKEQLKSVEGLEITADTMRLFFDSDILKFKNLLGVEVSEKKEKNVTLSLNTVISETYTVYIKSGYVPDKVNTQVEIKGYLEGSGDAEGPFTYPGKITITNMDIQRKLAIEKNNNLTFDQLTSMQSTLDNKTTVGLSAELYTYFTNAQVKEIERFLTVYYSCAVEADRLTGEDALADLTDTLKKKVRDKLLSKLGINSIAKNLGVRTGNYEVNVKGIGKDGEEYTVVFSGTIQAYLNAKDKPYAATISCSYVVTGTGSAKGQKISGTGGVTYANFENFADLMLSYINYAYSSSWGKKADTIASMMISKPLDEFVGGKYTNKIYNLSLNMAKGKDIQDIVVDDLKSDSKNYIKKWLNKFLIKCPVDVYVYNDEEELCGKIEDNIVTNLTDEVSLVVCGDEKYVYVAGHTYSIKLVGNASGSMTYQIEEYNGTELKRTVTTENIPLSKGKTYVSTLTGMPYLDNAVYAVYPENSETPMQITSDTYQDANVYYSMQDYGTENQNTTPGAGTISGQTGNTTHKHSWSKWITTSKATVFAAEVQQRTCSGCKKTEKRSVGTKLKPAIKINVTTVPLKVKQSTTKVTVSGLANGDSVKSWKSSNTKIVKVDNKGKITAQGKTGKATITVTLASGLTKKCCGKL